MANPSKDTVQSKHEVAATRADGHANSLSTNDQYAVEALSRDMGVDLAFVKELYVSELAQLEANARVQGFLSVLASRQVRLKLRAHGAAARDG